jgi:hypothetical protein
MKTYIHIKVVSDFIICIDTDYEVTKLSDIQFPVQYITIFKLLDSGWVQYIPHSNNFTRDTWTSSNIMRFIEVIPDINEFIGEYFTDLL